MLKRKLLVSAILATLSTAAFAAAPGFYVGAQLGWSKANYGLGDYSDTRTTPAAPFTRGNVNSSGAGGRLSAGYQFNQNWAAELGYTRYGNVNYNDLGSANGAYANGTVKNTAIDVVAKGIAPLDSGFNVFGKLGVAYDKITFQDSFSNRATNNQWRPTYGVGAGYDFNQNVTADISWMRVQNGGQVKTLDLIAAGIGYHFG